MSWVSTISEPRLLRMHFSSSIANQRIYSTQCTKCGISPLPDKQRLRSILHRILLVLHDLSAIIVRSAMIRLVRWRTSMLVLASRRIIRLDPFASLMPIRISHFVRRPSAIRSLFSIVIRARHRLRHVLRFLVLRGVSRLEFGSLAGNGSLRLFNLVSNGIFVCRPQLPRFIVLREQSVSTPHPPRNSTNTY